MHLAIPTSKPFSFHQTLAFIGRFMPIRTDYVVGECSVTAAIARSPARPSVVETPKQVRVFPTFDTLVELDGDEIGDAIGHAGRASRSRRSCAASR